MIGEWYQSHLTVRARALLPLSWIYHGVISVRRFCYRHRIFSVYRAPHPVVIVGNITVGGTGKTPLVAYLANALRAHGWQPGIVTRGFGRHETAMRKVDAYSTPEQVGDEALVLFQQTTTPIVVSRHRARAVRALIAEQGCNIILSDDGLQHYGLARDIEIAVIDGARLFGNQALLPAGPLREPISRLQEADMLVVQDGHYPSAYTMHLQGRHLVSLLDATHVVTLEAFAGQRVHAVAGVGNPERFFQSLRHAGVQVIPHVFADHHAYRAKDLQFADDLPVIMTEKDAVKCVDLATTDYWYLPVVADLPEVFMQALLQRLASLPSQNVSDKQGSHTG